MLVKKVYFNDFLNEFEKAGRKDNFSYQGKKALYNYLNELSEDLNEVIELDVISLCSEFSEYSNLEEFKKDYDIDDIEDIEDISFYTTVIKIDEDSFIIQDF